MPLLLAAAAAGCKKHGNGNAAVPKGRPVAADSGRTIAFPADSVMLAGFKTLGVGQASLASRLVFPARVVATAVPSKENPQKPVLLFDDQKLYAVYSQYIQNLSNLQRAKTNLARVKDLYANKVATGKDLIDAENEVRVLETQVIETESDLRDEGLDPPKLINPPLEIYWLIADVPESQLTTIAKNTAVTVYFNAFGNRQYKGRIDGIGEVMDNVTRMYKARITMFDYSDQILVGMFGRVQVENVGLPNASVPLSALVTVQGQHYVFVKKSDTTFERRSVSVGAQIGDYIALESGIRPGEQVVYTGVMQLKGISFGY
jgi:hypothetical protein